MAVPDLGLIVGIIGTVTSVMVYASPIPTFWYIYKKKSTEYFSALPYVCTLLTVLLGLYYGCIKENGLLIITINIIGLMFEASYLTIFLIYAAKFSRIKTIKQVALDLVIFGLAVGLTMLFSHGRLRVVIIGSFCSAVAVSMYAAPLSIMRLVIRTKNVDFMPLTLSAFLVINGSLWSAYSFFVRDIFIGIPSVLGSFLSFGQVVLYLCYRNAKKSEEKPPKKAEHVQEEGVHKIDIKEMQAEADAENMKQHQKTATGKVVDASQGDEQQQQHQVLELAEKTEDCHESETSTSTTNTSEAAAEAAAAAAEAAAAAAGAAAVAAAAAAAAAEAAAAACAS